jgi:hypothetical protein
MNKRLWLFGFLMAFLIPAVSSAQKLERTKNWEVGDKLTYSIAIRGLSTVLVEEVSEVTDNEIRMSQRVGERTYDAALSTRDMSRLRGVCQGSGQACTWSPGDVWASFPLEKGKMWSETHTVTNEGFITEVVSERTVEAVEKIDILAGRFQAYRVSATEHYTSRSKVGEGTYKGKGSMTYWVASIKGKVVLVKWEYGNTFGDRFERELTLAELK